MTKEMENQRALQEEMKGKLSRLRAVLLTGGDVSFSKLFDEFVQEGEWELALHVVCDYLLEPNTQAAPPTVIQQVQALHEAMRVEDSCVADLQRKAGQHVAD